MSLTNATPQEAARAARKSSRALAVLPAADRDRALTAVHRALADARDDILRANLRDLEAAMRAAEAGTLSQSLLKRLDLGREGKYEDMLQGVLDVRDLPDPIGVIGARTLLDDDLVLERKSCPIGVLLVIFEARPEVIANISALAIKSGNAAILKGGKESTESFKAIAAAVSRALAATAVPSDCLQLVTTRDAVGPLLELDRDIDLVIPRGGNELVRKVKASTQIPVLGHADGLCSVYLKADCDPAAAARLVVDAKLSYPAACNAAETLLVDEDALGTVLPPIAAVLLERGVSLRCDEAAKATLGATLDAHRAAILQDADEADFRTEFLGPTLAVKTVPRAATPEAATDTAVAHINEHGSHHTDAIVTASRACAERFLAGVDSASVFWNASTRIADGQRYGLGAEVGISTNKIHARGPVGLEGLTIYKWLLRGAGHVSADYGAGGKKWKHRRLPVGDDERYARTDEELDVLRAFRARANGV
ncbi:Aldehyde/histidinol dehydrogenase [Lineolata rhizophorae]|uniref:glutamate-5-semialdehyde dehydrogenase n=1 Tax=Lineolata rhizophorae TaxID=578093 RepID=A0A6A6P3S4_9PEZI|nr:Aldehyde/histidinol dehydrogenase [Lineolata rhizophorae]